MHKKLIKLFCLLVINTQIISREDFRQKSTDLINFWKNWSKEYEDTLDCLERYVETDIKLIRLFRLQKKLNAEREVLLKITENSLSNKKMLQDLQKRWNAFDQKWINWEKEFNNAINEIKNCKNTDSILIGLDKLRKQYLKIRREFIESYIK